MATSVDNSNSVVSPLDSTRTTRGTKIVKKGQDIDENMFLKILSAELANQDPTNSSSQSSTEYVSQLAQFSALQQMANLNSSNKLNTANSLVNKYITFSDIDSNGNMYNGQVVGVVKDGDDIFLNTVIGNTTDDSGNTTDNYKLFNINNVVKIDDMGDIFDSTTNNNLLMNASALIGKKVEVNEKDDNGNYYGGIVESVSRGSLGILVKVDVGNGETKDFYLDAISNVENP
ncbi:flagellar hook assembly protein FlgD [Clostridium sp. LBM24168]